MPGQGHPRGSSSLWLLVCAGLCSCWGRPADTLVVCHNAHCAEPTNPFQDDKLSSLDESLALNYQGRPLLDGLELDLLWEDETGESAGRCLFAHDRDHARPAVDALVAAEVIARYLEQPGEISWNGEIFLLRLELKGKVARLQKGADEIPALDLAGCALDLREVFYGAALRAGRQIEVIFDSSNPAVLRSLLDNDRFSSRPPDGNLQTALSADFYDSTPSGLALQRLRDFPAVDDVVFHGGWIREGHYQLFRALGLDLTLWMYSATADNLSAIERLRPRAVLTSEATVLRRWLGH